ncbi:MAG: DUF4388 domain-containing protein, partial [Myxococcota bacterium]|nr:DUF4388 domain-containing protein [Myxococcota bacterium]
ARLRFRDALKRRGAPVEKIRRVVVDESSRLPGPWMPAAELPEAWRDALGVGAAARLRVAHRGPEGAWLESDAAELPAGVRRPPVLRAELEVLPLADLLGALHAARRSGWLLCRYRDHAKTVFLHRGEVVFATSNQRVDRLGECLLRAGILDLEQLREAERCFAPPQRFGRVLVERGFLTPRELWNGVRYQVEEIVRSLFAWPSGVVLFHEGPAQPDNVVRLALETRRLVAEGVQRREELRKFLDVLEDARAQLAPVPGFRGSLAGAERALVDALGEGRSFCEVCRALDLDRESAARSVQLLRLVGAVRILRRAREDVVAPSDLDAPDEAALRERAGSLVKLIAALAGALDTAEGGRGRIFERLDRVFDDAVGRFPALLTGVRPGRGGALDPEVLVDRARKLPGDREGQLAEALGEMVAYLEFEVRNHPAIDEPQALLEGLAPLRRSAAGG